MSDFDDAIADMTADLLSEAGAEFSYVRGTTTTTVTMRKSHQPSYLVDIEGMQSEVTPTDFIGLTANLPYSPPRKGDKIIDGDTVYLVQPTTSEKTFRVISPQMTRIHTVQSQPK